MNNSSNPPESDKDVQLKLEDVKKLNERKKELEEIHKNASNMKEEMEKMYKESMKEEKK